MASLGGEVFLDVNANGMRDADESGAADVRVYIDSNDNAQLDRGELSTTTNDEGFYRFRTLDPGDYIVRVLTTPETQTAPRQFLGTGYTEIGDGTGTNPTQLFRMTTGGEVTPIGQPTGERIHGLVQTNSGAIIGVNHQTDTLFSIDPVTGQERELATSEFNLVAGLAYDPIDDEIYTLARRNGFLELVTVSPDGGSTELTAPRPADLLATNFGSTFFRFDTGTGTAVEIPRQPGSPFSSTLDIRSDDAVFGLQGLALNQFSFTAAGSSAVQISTLSENIEAISFDTNDQLFGLDNDSAGDMIRPIDVTTGTVGDGFRITLDGEGLSNLQGFDIGPDGTYFAVGTDQLYTIDPTSGIATAAPQTTLPNSTPILTNVSVGRDGSVFGTLFNTTTPIAQIDPTTGVATPLGNNPTGSPYSALVAIGSETPSFPELDNVSDLAFDPTTGRIVGFDNASDQFFAFTTDGVGTLLGTASRPLNSWSLAFDGTDFVMFDQDDPLRTSVITVDPVTGEIGPGFTASQRLPAESLFLTNRGNTAHRVTVGEEDLTGFDFGVTELQTDVSGITDFPTVISELVTDVVFGSADTDLLIELRGLPNGQISDNTYFVTVSETGNNRGRVQNIFDLSGLQFGENGYLVLLQGNSPHTVDPASNVVRATGDGGFLGLPGGIYSETDTSFSVGLVEGPFGASNAAGYFLIESDVRPELGDNIDEDFDGLADPDGVKSDWDVLDSVSIHRRIDDQAYGQVVLYGRAAAADQDMLPTVEPGTPIIVSRASGYGARVGESVGSEADDWMTGQIIDVDTDASGPLLQVRGFISTLPTPISYHTRTLDHFGGPNFAGGVRGTIQFEPSRGSVDSDDPNAPLPDPFPAEGVTVLADENGNGQVDSREIEIDPDTIADLILGPFPDFQSTLPVVPLTHAFPGVTISTADPENFPFDFQVQAVREQNGFVTSGNFIFSHAGVPFFNDIRKLRFDFHRPASEVSVRVIGAQSSNIPHYGRLEIYNSSDELIDVVLSRGLIGAARQTISVSSSGDDIAYAVAYSDTTTFETATPFGRYDLMTFTQSEATAVTDENGQYEIKNVVPGDYELTVVGDENTDLLGVSVQPITVERYENFVFSSQLRENTVPSVDAEVTFITDENPGSGASIGFIEAEDLDLQFLQFAIMGDNPAGLLIDSTTGEIFTGADTVLDFESDPEVVLDVSVSDGLAESITRVTIQIRDINEAPDVEMIPFLVTEGTTSGTTVGQISAQDPDVQLDQTIRFEIVGGPDAAVFAINEVTGIVTLVDATAVDFEDAEQLQFTVRISDDADPVAFTEVNQIVTVIDQNDRPIIRTRSFDLAENPTSGLVGRLRAVDPDVGQSISFELLGGPDAGFFAVSRDGDISLRDGVMVDFEARENYLIRVRAIDSGAPPLSADANISINVIDVDEAPVLSQSSAALAEDAVPGTVVATLGVSDPDAGSAVPTLALGTGDVAANFQFDAATGQLTVAPGASFDFETQSSLSVPLVASSDDLESPVTLFFTVVLGDANDPPIVTSSQFIVSELAVPGTVVGRVEIQVFDPDTGDQVTAEIIGGSAADLFVVEPVTRILRVAQGALFDADVSSDPLTLEVRVTDLAGSNSTGTITIVLNEVNEPPIFFGDQPGSFNVESGEFFEFSLAESAFVDPEGSPFVLTAFDRTGQLPPWLRFDPATRTLSGIPRPSDVGAYDLTIRAFEFGPLNLRTDVSFPLNVEIGDTALTNKRDRLDVDASNQVTALDALRVINFLLRNGSGSAIDPADLFNGFVDVTGDGVVTALDALQVVNGLDQLTIDFGEGEAVAGESSIDDDDEESLTDLALAELFAGPSLF